LLIHDDTINEVHQLSAFGGLIKKNKHFSTVNFDGYDFGHAAGAQVRTVPTVAMRATALTLPSVIRGPFACNGQLTSTDSARISGRG